jgi:TolB protein
VFRIFLLVILITIGVIGWVGVRMKMQVQPTPLDPTLQALATALQYTPTASISPTTAPPSPTFTTAPTRISSLGALIYAARNAGHTHLWAYTPGDATAVQLTKGDWDDRNPAVSPDGKSIAFSSNRDGTWDLYLFELRTGGVRRLTDTLGFEGHPSWSPDGLWLACEFYYDGDFNIWIIPVNGGQSPIQLTSHPAMDLSPSWDPNGRRIAFISYRDGHPDVFLADLENPDNRFRNLTNTSNVIERNPVFSPDGSRIAYSVDSQGLNLILIQDLNDLSKPPDIVSQARAAAWSPDGRYLATVLSNAIETFLQVTSLTGQGISTVGYPPLNGIQSLDWSEHSLPGEVYVRELNNSTSTPLFVPSAIPEASGRLSLVELPDVIAPHPTLSDAVDEAFNALRKRTAAELGWDFLGDLENAFVGINDPLPPGYAYNDWLYTGRAFAFQQTAVQAGWVELIREDYGGHTYWRVFVRTALQDGSIGEPLRSLPWDFSTRHTGDPHAYDQGGSLRSSIPEGYFVDFTQLAADYGFERLPALTDWRTFYPSARFNEFVRTDGLDWTSAMLEIYPASAIVTPTPYQTPTPTPTRTPRPTATPWWWRWRTPTPSSP